MSKKKCYFNLSDVEFSNESTGKKVRVQTDTPEDYKADDTVEVPFDFIVHNIGELCVNGYISKNDIKKLIEKIMEVWDDDIHKAVISTGLSTFIERVDGSDRKLFECVKMRLNELMG